MSLHLLTISSGFRIRLTDIIYGINFSSLFIMRNKHIKLIHRSSERRWCEVLLMRAVELRTMSMMDESFVRIEGRPLLPLLMFCTVPNLSKFCTILSISYFLGLSPVPDSRQYFRRVDTKDFIWYQNATKFTFCYDVKTIIAKIWKLI